MHLEMEQKEDEDEYDGLLPRMTGSVSSPQHNRRVYYTVLAILLLSLSVSFGMTKHTNTVDNDLAFVWKVADDNWLPETSQPVQVFLMAGQSNMVGFGSVQHLHSLIEMGNYTHLVDENDQWRVRSRVRVILPSLKVESLTVGLGFNESFIGPELGFGWTISESLPNQNILIIKAAWDGYSLAVNFRPPSAGLGNYTNFRHKQFSDEKYGAAYREMMSIVNQSLEALAEPYEIKGFVWFQGWADQSPQKNSEYKRNLVYLIQDIRSALHVPDLCVVIGECGQYRGKPKDQENLQRVRDAQKAVTELFPNTSQLVDARAFTHENRTEHYNPGFHYHGHADTYYDIGAAFGEAMLELMGVRDHTE
jgi:alpha-galactosidase